jgi:carbamate kinase
VDPGPVPVVTGPVRPLLVVAVGGNALLRRGEPPDVPTQRANAAAAAVAIAPLAATHRLVVTHGNGPQVGLLARQDEAVPSGAPTPLDVLDAETEGSVGYLLAEQLGRLLGEERVAVVLTRVEVDPADPAFDRPDKPIGAIHTEADARRLAVEHGWAVAPDGDAWRRVVASPRPRRIVDLPAVRALVDAGLVVVCAGGGGIPVAPAPDGTLLGVEAVVDKDRTSALLAADLGAAALLVLTDVEAVVDGWGTPAAVPVRRASVAWLRSRTWAAGSMGPKVEAACAFVEATGAPAWIGALGAATDVVAGRSGTLVVPHEAVSPPHAPR